MTEKRTEKRQSSLSKTNFDGKLSGPPTHIQEEVPVESAADEPGDDPYLDDYFHDEPGSPPGTLSIDENAHPSTLVLIDFTEQYATRRQMPNPTACQPYTESVSVSWFDVQGLGSEDVLLGLGEVFGLHPLLLEDVVNVPQRPKIEEHEDHLLIVMRMVRLTPEADGFESEQVSFVLGKHYLLTVQEEPEHDTFHRVRERIRTGGAIRKYGVDYLAYALLDTVIDGFFPVLEAYGERIEALEDEVVLRPNRSTLAKVYDVKRELLALRRAVWPQREAVYALVRNESPLIQPEVQVYLRDCYDHANHVLDMLESYRELTSSLMDVYMSSVNNRMNEVMKFLTVISSIFIPLTFIAGIYGMNFDPDESPFNMPELDWYWGYPMCLLLMILVAVSSVTFFWRRGWFEDFSAFDWRDD
jgi:magnesium transporter